MKSGATHPALGRVGPDATAMLVLAAVAIASGITALTFTYRDENNNVTASPELIRTVEISVTAQTATKGAYVTMVDRVRLRNR